MGIQKISLEGFIQPPQNLELLQNSFTDFDTLLKDVDDILSPTVSILQDLIPLLEFPEDINKAITELSTVIAAIEAVTAALIAIPIVGEVVAGVDEVTDDIIEIVKEVQESVIQPIIDFCQPIETAIQDVEKPLQDIDAAVVSLEGSVAKWGPALSVIQEALALAAAIGNAFDAAGQKAVADVFDELVDAYNTVVDDINKPLEVINDAMEDINKVLSPLSDDMKKLKMETFDEIGSHVALIDKTLTTLNPLHEFLSHIQVVIKPFEWVLDKTGEIINKVLGPVLNPLLEPLEDKILGVIGLPPDFISQLEGAIGDSSTSSSTQNNSGSIVANQSTVQKSQGDLQASMEKFVSGDINTICQNLSEIIQQNLNQS